MKEASFLSHLMTDLSEGLEMTTEESLITEDELLSAIAFRVGELMDRNPELLFSYLYRLDVKEESLNNALHTHSQSPIALRLANLILDRQKARWKTKQEYKSEGPIDGWEW